ncbi:molybdenum cofactor biosynthesis protein MoaE [Aquimarina sp. U1-2]|uniref:molybdenum cofactor biosynthesis protein MoaE n=1 Tax=Aquimarina sp. U1-2 TaxID=2823141 RepID=UPI001AECF266|nr:molybdenum cofactor biosynthesis protein MoaE [Aquimarina sp. U1-2]MBP2831075.1 molybdenum cofactor biosynthesis protein MoaE [Aquimarina sp. U1-2]
MTKSQSFRPLAAVEKKNQSIQLVNTINIAKAIEQLENSEASAQSIFIGTVPSMSGSFEVKKLFFESYEQMAIKEMAKISDVALSEFNLKKVILWHCLSTKVVGETVVFVGTCSTHRADAIAATKYIIDTLKEMVPIWKKEYFKNGSIWANAHP